MTVTVSYTETRTSTVTIDQAEAHELLTKIGYGTVRTTSDAELATTLRDELLTVDSSLPAALEPLIGRCAAVSFREWEVTDR
ncbi:MAG: hypothetical protein WAX14_08385 [Rhodococcus sp. (in: high G+C Gram-positive bacteria)]|uniref:hypothetical protein n=1 Tax=Rhodococcus sp. TaxID=1831 RepID=UPI003BB77DCC